MRGEEHEGRGVCVCVFGGCQREMFPGLLYKSVLLPLKLSDFRQARSFFHFTRLISVSGLQFRFLRGKVCPNLMPTFRSWVINYNFS